jgi:periplasmic divalent cation tolerance protein
VPDTDYSQVSTTTDSCEAAEALASSAVEARVAACAQVVGPIKSTYWWEGKIDKAEEYLILFKTPNDQADALQEHILAHHSYDVPEVIRTPITGGNPAYLAWLTDETTAR